MNSDTGKFLSGSDKKTGPAKILRDRTDFTRETSGSDQKSQQGSDEKPVHNLNCNQTCQPHDEARYGMGLQGSLSIHVRKLGDHQEVAVDDVRDGHRSATHHL